MTRVYITENNINGLAFPPMEGSLVIFGLGYGVETLSTIPWLRKVGIIYWGDIDTHGFAILDRLRMTFPDCRPNSGGVGPYSIPILANRASPKINFTLGNVM